jgi:hypothetical protein
MAELFPSDAALEALGNAGGDTQLFGDSGLPMLLIGESPWYVNELKLRNWLDRLLRYTLGALRVYKDGALTFAVTAGAFMDGDTARAYAGATAQALVNNATNYIYLTAGAVLTVNQTGFPVPSVTPHIPLATIVTAAGAYDFANITDYRARAVYTVLR